MALPYRDFRTKKTPRYFCDLILDNLFHEREVQIFTKKTEVHVFTWNPSPKVFPDDLEYKQKWEFMIRKCLKTFRRCMSYYMCIPEISDQGRLHCHGWFVIDDKIKWIKSVLPLLKRNGFIKFNKAKTIKACEYSMKDLEETFGIIPDANVFCNLNSYQYLEDMKVTDLELNADKIDWKHVDITTYFT